LFVLFIVDVVLKILFDVVQQDPQRISTLLFELQTTSERFARGSSEAYSSHGDIARHASCLLSHFHFSLSHACPPLFIRLCMLALALCIAALR
jgi:hypothetical protein